MNETSSLASTSLNSDSEPKVAMQHKQQHQPLTVAVTSTHSNNYATMNGHFNEQTTKLVSSSSISSTISASSSRLLSFIHSSIIGLHTVIPSPFIGFDRSLRHSHTTRPLIYADWIASSRALHFIEQHIQTHILPTYGNTHTVHSLCGQQMSALRAEARAFIHATVRGSKDDVTLFTGSGSTSAIKQLAHYLNLQPQQSQAFVVVGPYEHHSNLLCWRDCVGIDNVITIEEDEERGGVSLSHLSATLEHLSSTHPSAGLIGSFSAASNVTGQLTDTVEVSRVLHRYGALAFFDYAAAAPYTAIDMNPLNDSSLSKDAVFFSVHKFIGGVGTPGVLCVKKQVLMRGAVNGQPVAPYTVGGGAVFYVSPSSHRYLESFEEREEGGTPDIVGAVRAGLVIQLKSAVGVEVIEKTEEQLLQRALSKLLEEPNFILLGKSCSQRLPIISFLIRHSPSNSFLHPNYITRLLNDLFGIQTRSGCMCAGPYVHRLLGITALAHSFEQCLITHKWEVLRPGFTRLSLHYCVSDEEVDYIIDALVFISRHAWELLGLYGFYNETGEFRYKTSFVGRKWLNSVSYEDGVMKYTPTDEHEPREATAAERRPLHTYIEEARNLLSDARFHLLKSQPVDEAQFLPAEVAQLRWFLLPSESVRYLKSESGIEQTELVRVENNPIQVQHFKQQLQHTLPQSYDASMNHSMAAVKSDSVSHERVSVSSVRSVLDAKRQAVINGRNNYAANINGLDQLNGHKSSIQTNNQHAITPLHTQRPSAGIDDHRQQQHDNYAAHVNTPHEAQPKNSHLIEMRLKRKALQRQQKQAKQQQTANGNPSSDPSAHRVEVCKNCYHTHWKSDAEALANLLSADRLTKECASCPCTHFLPHLPNSPAAVQHALKKLTSLAGRAIMEHDMIRDGDRVLIGLSGGKDSLSLLHVLKALQKKAPIRFELAACTVDPQSAEYDPSTLKFYLAALGIPYFYESEPILANAKTCMLSGDSCKKASICAYCSRMKRGILYNCCRREGYNVLALGQHTDDLCESLLMSIFHNGTLRTQKANYRIAAGDIRVIRPLIYARERLTREYALIAHLPIINENCPACFAAPKERHRVKLLLAQQEHLFPNLHSNIIRAMQPLIAIKAVTNGVKDGDTLNRIGKVTQHHTTVILANTNEDDDE